MQPAHPPNSASTWPTRPATGQGSPRATRFTYYPKWSEAQVQHHQRGGDGRKVSMPLAHYQTRNSPRSHGMHDTYYDLHQTRTHAKFAKELSPRSPRMGFTRPPEDRVFPQPSVPLRSRPQSARNTMDLPYQHCFPGFKPIVARNFIDMAQREETSAMEKAAEKVQTDVKKQTVMIKEFGGANVSPDDLRKAAASLKEKLLDKFGSLTRAFRAVDKDGSGTITRDELAQYLEVMNLHMTIKKDVLEGLFRLIDADESGTFDFREFSRVMTAGDVLNMEAVRDRYDGYAAKAQEEEDRQRAIKEAEAALVGMTAEEYEAYWAPTMANKKQLTSAENAQVARDRWGHKIKGPVQGHAI